MKQIAQEGQGVIVICARRGAYRAGAKFGLTVRTNGLDTVDETQARLSDGLREYGWARKFLVDLV